MKVTWGKYWRVDDGEVKYDDGFTMARDSDYVYFDIDPDTQREQLDDEDPRIVHVDDLFENEEDAKAEAEAFCESQIEKYGKRLDKLRG